MTTNEQNLTQDLQWKRIYLLGGVAAFLCIGGTLFDIVFGSISSSSLAALPQDAAGRFAELQENVLLGLYHFDLLNVATSLLMLPVFFAVFSVHRNVNLPYAALAFMAMVTGTLVFVTTNSGLAMLELARKYYAAVNEAQRTALLAAGEALFVKSEHGSLGTFSGFFLSTIGSLSMAFVIAHGRQFGTATAWTGMIGQGLLLLYVLLLALFPALETFAVALAAPGGILSLVWLILIALKLLNIGGLQIHVRAASITH